MRRKTILSQTIFARILTLNATFAPRSPLHCSLLQEPLALPVALFLLCFIKPSIQRSELLGLYRNCSVLGRSKICKPFFENSAGNAANCSENLRRNWSIKEFCADRKRARNFCAGNAFPAQTKLYSLVCHQCGIGVPYATDLWRTASCFFYAGVFLFFSPAMVW